MPWTNFSVCGVHPTPGASDVRRTRRCMWYAEIRRRDMADFPLMFKCGMRRNTPILRFVVSASSSKWMLLGELCISPFHFNVANRKHLGSKLYNGFYAIAGIRCVYASRHGGIETILGTTFRKPKPYGPNREIGVAESCNFRVREAGPTDSSGMRMAALLHGRVLRSPPAQVRTQPLISHSFWSYRARKQW